MTAAQDMATETRSQNQFATPVAILVWPAWRTRIATRAFGMTILIAATTTSALNAWKILIVAGFYTATIYITDACGDCRECSREHESVDNETEDECW